MMASKTARERVQGHNVAVAHRRQRNEAEIDQVSGDGEIVLQRTEADKCIGHEQADETE
jgi:hypothetical protein